MSQAFEKIKAGMEDAIAHAGGDTSRGRVTVVPTQILFQVPNAISKATPPITLRVLHEIVYNANPAHFYDKVDGDCVMGFEHAHQDKPQEYFDALTKAQEIAASRIPQAELIKFIGRDGILGKTADFTWFWGHEWFVETRFGNFMWSDPDYPNGDNSLTFFEGDIREFADKMGCDIGRSKGQRLISSMVDHEVELRIPQLDN